MEQLKKKIMGFTLVELLATVVILSILASFAIPMFTDLLNTRRLQQASESVYNDILLAQSESVKKGGAIYFAFKNGANWCYGVNNGSTCDCQVANSCQLNGTNKVMSASDFINVSFDDTGFGGNTDTKFENIRGTANNSGTLKLTSDGKEVSISIYKMGYVKICSNDLKRYQAC